MKLINRYLLQQHTVWKYHTIANELNKHHVGVVSVKRFRLLIKDDKCEACLPFLLMSGKCHTVIEHNNLSRANEYNRNPNRIKIERKSVLVSKFIRYYFYRCQFEHNARVQLIPHNLKYNPIKSVIVSTCWYLNQLAKSFGVGTYGRLWICSRFHRIVSILCVIHVGFIRNRYSVQCYGCRILQANNHTWCRMSSRQNSTNDRSYIVCWRTNNIRILLSYATNVLHLQVFACFLFTIWWNCVFSYSA